MQSDVGGSIVAMKTLRLDVTPPSSLQGGVSLNSSDLVFARLAHEAKVEPRSPETVGSCARRTRAGLRDCTAAERRAPTYVCFTDSPRMLLMRQSKQRGAPPGASAAITARDQVIGARDAQRGPPERVDLGTGGRGSRAVCGRSSAAGAQVRFELPVRPGPIAQSSLQGIIIELDDDRAQPPDGPMTAKVRCGDLP